MVLLPETNCHVTDGIPPRGRFRVFRALQNPSRLTFHRLIHACASLAFLAVAPSRLRIAITAPEGSTAAACRVPSAAHVCCAWPPWSSLLPGRSVACASVPSYEPFFVPGAAGLPVLCCRAAYPANGLPLQVTCLHIACSAAR